MKINWLVATGYVIDPTIDLDRLKSIGPIWGSWKTWRSCSTDNVICHDLAKSRELIGRAFQAVSNFYVPKNHYQDLNRPIGVKLYDGDYIQEVDDIEDVIAGHLAAVNSDIVLMLGFDLRTIRADADRLVNHRNQNRHGLLRSMINLHSECQWAVIDHEGDLDKSYRDLPNLTCDNMQNALQLLI